MNCMVGKMKRINSTFFIFALFAASCTGKENISTTGSNLKPANNLPALSAIRCPVQQCNIEPNCDECLFPTKVTSAGMQTLYVEPDAYPPIVGLWSEHATRRSANGKSWIGTAPGNGERDLGHHHKKRHTAVFIHEKYNYEDHPDVLVWLHGHYGFNKFGIRIFRHLDQLFERGQNPVVIAIEQPWSVWTKTPKSRNGTGPFTKLADFNRWLDYMLNVLHELGIPPEKILSQNITVIGHSAGGSGLMAMAKSGALAVLKPGKIVFSDSSYGRWFDVTYDTYISSAPHTKVYVLTQKHGRPWKSMKRFFAERKKARLPVAGNVVHVPTSLTHKQIGDNSVLYPAGPFQ